MPDYTIVSFENSIITLAFDGRRVNFPLPIVDGKYPEGEALNTLLTAYVRNARAAPPAPVASNAAEIQRLVARPADFELRRAVMVARNRLLLATDWTQMNDSPLSADLKLRWKICRQAWRDISRQSGFPSNVVWPVPPDQVKGPAGGMLTAARGAPTHLLSVQSVPTHITVGR
ncbi:hypothetical protein Rfer_4390 (plasmid) [Rhodoferax ferrireducens T118]|uniref:Phage tail assembly chaperone-like domain-containing protein n=2 Tax=Rhodoferax ferrireducens TaxID=192843 RepID=Q21Q69_ALBFT|nr:hypothetical protein Rfer_4390 [Rhodoferax ferrireducens T118]